MFQAKFVEKIKTHILWSKTPPPPENCTFKRWGKILYSRTGHMAI